MRYAVVIEKGETSYGAYLPDLPGCVAVGETIEEVKGLIAEAIEFHIEGMLKEGLPIPKPTYIGLTLSCCLEFLDKNFSNLCVLCVSVVKSITF